MPYIKQEDRSKFEDSIVDLASKLENAGQINYCITKLIHLYIKKKGLNYATLNEVDGALDCCKQELSRTVTAPYEDIKRQENGAVGVLDIEIDFSKNINKLEEKYKNLY